jgi:DNA-binding Lrp family transcriptional regulator
MKRAKRDAAIVKVLKQHPDATATFVAERTNIPLSTVSKRLKGLTKAGVVRIQAVFPSQALISINVNSKELHEKATDQNAPYRDISSFVDFLHGAVLESGKGRSFRDAIQIDDAFAILGGHCDIVMLISSTDSQAIYNFVTGVVREIPSVKDTHTSLMFHSKPTVA